MIGEAPSRTSDPFRPLTGKSGRFLRALCGWSEYRFRTGLELRNLLSRYPGRHRKGARFPIDDARAMARLLTWERAMDDRDVVFLGWRVARAFGLERSFDGYLTWTPFDRGVFIDQHGGYGFSMSWYRCRVAVLPHPSGVNRWWNQPRNALAARAFLLKLLPRKETA